MINNSKSAFNNTVVDLIQIPLELKSTNKSLLDLLKGIMNNDDSIIFDLELIESELAKRVGLIEKWMEYSENKRSTGYYFKTNQDVYEVGNLGPSYSINEVWAFDNGIKACAFFIQKELNSALVTD